jgi:diadenosine tetraphosphate (Ap4A) HIT family hydrolase
MFNPTIARFGYPATLVREYEHWVVLLRPAQVTAGSLILAAKSKATSYGSLPVEAFVEQGTIVAEIEMTLRAKLAYDRINYLMLMMVDPNVHFHVIPRYEGSRIIAGIELADAGWPGPPDLKSAHSLDDRMIAAGRDEIASAWRSGQTNSD